MCRISKMTWRSSSGCFSVWPGREPVDRRSQLPERVSAAILNWNGGDLVTRCLTTLLRQSHPIEDRIVVDNASTDGSLEALQSADPNLRVIRNQTNLGFAAA